MKNILITYYLVYKYETSLYSYTLVGNANY